MAEYQHNVKQDATPAPVYAPTIAPTVQSQTTTLANDIGNPPSFIEKVEPQQDVVQESPKGMIDQIQRPDLVTPLDRLGETSAWVDCPFCHRRTQTRVVHEDSSTTILAGVLCCLLCVCLACVPCLAGWCQNIQHFCSQCNKELTFKPHDGNITVKAPHSNDLLPSQYAIASQQSQVPQTDSTTATNSFTAGGQRVVNK